MHCVTAAQLSHPDPLNPDFEEALLISKDVVDDLNAHTRKLGQAKVGACIACFC